MPADPAPPFTTVAQALAWAVGELTTAGSRAPRAEAETLLGWASGWQRTRIVLALPEELPGSAVDRFVQAVARRANGVPLQYVTGQAGFYGRLFAVREGCLIPRPETEVLADTAIAWIRTHMPAAHVLDLGSGSGAIAITLALECPSAHVTALDISPDAIAITRENALHLGARVDTAVADGFAWLETRGESAGARARLQVLVSNPPYIPSAVVDTLDAEVRDFEPRLALDGGDDGLALYRRMSSLGSSIFDPGPAALFLEVGDGQAAAVLRMFTVGGAASESATGSSRAVWPGRPSWADWQFTVVQDLRGVDRIVAGERL